MKKICLLLANGFEMSEASVFTDVFGWNQTDGNGQTELITVGMHEKLKCTWNFTVVPEMQLKDLNVSEFDALAIPGGFEEAGFYQDAFHPDFLKTIQNFHNQKKPIASICVGALPLGKSGILKGVHATTYNLSSGIRQKQLAAFGAILQPDKPIVMDQNIITSYNPSTAFDVSFLLLEVLTNQENTTHVKKQMGFL
jgi:4-methyl-5(b-hydroxyethyl)-thiazole monophosphate biosynthesis